MAASVLSLPLFFHPGDPSLQRTLIDQLKPKKVQHFPQVRQPQNLTLMLTLVDPQLGPPQPAYSLHPAPQEPRGTSLLLLAVSVHPQGLRCGPSVEHLPRGYAKEQEL